MTGSGSGEERTWEVERDRFGVMFSGPLEVGECKQVVEASAYRAEREAREKAERERDEYRDLHDEAEERLTTLRHTTVARLCHERDLLKGRAEKAEEALRPARAGLEALEAVRFSSNWRDHDEAMKTALASLSALPVPRGEEQRG